MEKKLPIIKEAICELLKNLECPICLEILDDPVSTTCYHQFCRSCIRRVLSSSQNNIAQCPLCKAKITNRGLREKPGLSELLSCSKEIADAFQEDTGIQISPAQRHLLELVSSSPDNCAEPSSVPLTTSGPVFNEIEAVKPKRLPAAVRPSKPKRRKLQNCLAVFSGECTAQPQVIKDVNNSNIHSDCSMSVSSDDQCRKNSGDVPSNPPPYSEEPTKHVVTIDAKSTQKDFISADHTSSTVFPKSNLFDSLLEPDAEDNITSSFDPKLNKSSVNPPKIYKHPGHVAKNKISSNKKVLDWFRKSPSNDNHDTKDKALNSSAMKDQKPNYIPIYKRSLVENKKSSDSQDTYEFVASQNSFHPKKQINTRKRNVIQAKKRNSIRTKKQKCLEKSEKRCEKRKNKKFSFTSDDDFEVPVTPKPHTDNLRTENSANSGTSKSTKPQIVHSENSPLKNSNGNLLENGKDFLEASAPNISDNDMVLEDELFVTPAVNIAAYCAKYGQLIDSDESQPEIVAKPRKRQKNKIDASTKSIMKKSRTIELDCSLSNAQKQIAHLNEELRRVENEDFVIENVDPRKPKAKGVRGANTDKGERPPLINVINSPKKPFKKFNPSPQKIASSLLTRTPFATSTINRETVSLKDLQCSSSLMSKGIPSDQTTFFSPSLYEFDSGNKSPVEDELSSKQSLKDSPVSPKSAKLESFEKCDQKKSNITLRLRISEDIKGDILDVEKLRKHGRSDDGETKGLLDNVDTLRDILVPPLPCLVGNSKNTEIAEENLLLNEPQKIMDLSDSNLCDLKIDRGKGTEIQIGTSNSQELCKDYVTLKSPKTRALNTSQLNTVDQQTKELHTNEVELMSATIIDKSSETTSTASKTLAILCKSENCTLENCVCISGGGKIERSSKSEALHTESSEDLVETGKKFPETTRRTFAFDASTQELEELDDKQNTADLFQGICSHQSLTDIAQFEDNSTLFLEKQPANSGAIAKEQLNNGITENNKRDFLQENCLDQKMRKDVPVKEHQPGENDSDKNSKIEARKMEEKNNAQGDLGLGIDETIDSHSQFITIVCKVPVSVLNSNPEAILSNEVSCIANCPNCDNRVTFSFKDLAFESNDRREFKLISGTVSLEYRDKEVKKIPSSCVETGVPSTDNHDTIEKTEFTEPSQRSRHNNILNSLVENPVEVAKNSSMNDQPLNDDLMKMSEPDSEEIWGSLPSQLPSTPYQDLTGNNKNTACFIGIPAEDPITRSELESQDVWGSVPSLFPPTPHQDTMRMDVPNTTQEKHFPVHEVNRDSWPSKSSPLSSKAIDIPVSPSSDSRDSWGSFDLKAKESRQSVNNGFRGLFKCSSDSKPPVEDARKSIESLISKPSKDAINGNNQNTRRLENNVPPEKYVEIKLNPTRKQTTLTPQCGPSKICSPKEEVHSELKRASKGISLNRQVSPHTVKLVTEQGDIELNEYAPKVKPNLTDHNKLTDFMDERLENLLDSESLDEMHPEMLEADNLVAGLKEVEKQIKPLNSSFSRLSKNKNRNTSQPCVPVETCRVKRTQNMENKKYRRIQTFPDWSSSESSPEIHKATETKNKICQPTTFNDITEETSKRPLQGRNQLDVLPSIEDDLLDVGSSSSSSSIEENFDHLNTTENIAKVWANIHADLGEETLEDDFTSGTRRRASDVRKVLQLEVFDETDDSQMNREVDALKMMKQKIEAKRIAAWKSRLNHDESVKTTKAVIQEIDECSEDSDAIPPTPPLLGSKFNFIHRPLH